MGKDDSEGDPSPGSFNASWNVGGTGNGGSASIVWHAGQLADCTALSSVTFYGASDGREEIPASNGRRQAKILNNGLVDILKENSSMTIAFYPEEYVGVRGADNFYAVTAAPTWKAVITQEADSTVSYKKYEGGVLAGEWVLSETATPKSFTVLDTVNSRKDVHKEETNGDELVLTDEVWDTAPDPDELVKKKVTTSKEFPWGTETLSETEYIDGSPRTTSYSYYGDGDGVTDADTWYGKQKRVLYPDGNWTFHQYTGLPEGATEATWGPFKSTAAPTSVPASGTGYVKDISYQDRTKETYTDGFLTAKSRQALLYYDSETFAGSENLTVETRETWYGPGANDKLTTTSYTSGYAISSPALFATVNPDGTCSKYEYQTGTFDGQSGTFTQGSGTDKKTTVYQGKVNATGTGQDLVAFQSTATETIENADGQTLQERELVYDGTNFNNVLSTTRHTYVDGNLTETRRDGDVIYSAVYAGDELQSSSDEYGAVTTMVETQNFAVTTVDDGEVVHTSESETDGAGRISTQTDQGLETGYAYSTAPGGGEIVTTTLPSGATSIAESYLDGHPKSTTGTAEIATAYDYSAANGELITTQTTSDGEGHNRTVVTTRDMMGRTKTVTRPKFGGGTTVSSHAYNAAGQLESVTLDDSSVAAPQAVTYNAMGGQELSGLDMDGGGLSTAAGSPDRVSKSESFYATQNGKWYQVNKLGRLLPTGWVTLQEIWSRVDGRETITKGPGGRTITTTTEVDRPNKTVTITTLDSEIGTPSKAVYKGGMTLVETQEPWQYGTTNKTTYHYDANGRLETATDALGRSTGFTYQPQGTNGAGQEATRTLPGNATISTTYNARGQVEVEEGSGTYWKTFLYNGFGELSRLGTKRDSGIGWTDFIPDWGTGLLAQKKIAGTDVADYTYNAAGWLETRTLPQGPTTTTYGHTKAGEVSSIDYSDSTPDVTGMLYDRGGRLTNVTDAAGDRTITYSDFDQRANETWSGSGILSGYNVSRGHTANRRDSLDAGGPGGFNYPGVTYGYNSANNRLETISQGSLAVTYTPQAGMTLPQAVTSAWSGGATMTRTLGYDALGRATYVANSVGSTVISAHGTQAAPIQYDNAGRRHIIPREDGTNWTYGYNDRNEVTSGVKTFGSAPPVPGHQFTYDYDGIGNRLTATMGDDGLSSLSYTANDKNQYSSYSNPTKQWITGEAATDAQVFVNGAWAWRNGKFFAKAIDLGNQSGPVWKAVTVESKLLPGGGNMPVATGGGHVLAPPQNVSPGYDANDNVTGDGLWNYTWDGENRLVGVETVSAVPETGQRKIAYAYDFEGRRIQTIRYTKSGANWVTDPAGPTVMLYDGWNLIAERNSTADKKYLWGLDLSGTLEGTGGIGGLLAMTDSASGKTALAVSDANGNVSALVDATTGEVAARYGYGPFGEPLQAVGPLAQTNPFRWSSKYSDGETGLVYYPGSDRITLPSLGRWLQRDPINELGFKALQGIKISRIQRREEANLYAFVGNNPVNKFDPFGLKLDSRSESKVSQLYSKLQPIARKHIEALNKKLKSECKVAKVIDGLRSVGDQSKIPSANTRARGLNSYHLWGLAYDIGIFNLPPGETDPEKAKEYLENDPAYKKYGAVGTDAGLEWGGNWTSIVDYPHYQYPLSNLGYSKIQDLAKAYTDSESEDAPNVWIESQ